MLSTAAFRRLRSAEVLGRPSKAWQPGANRTLAQSYAGGGCLPESARLLYHQQVAPAIPTESIPMIRNLAAVAAVLFLASHVSAQQPKQLSIRWHGQAFFEIKTSAGTRIVIDPHAIEAFGERKNIKADLICISHLHNDHTQVGVIENYEPSKFKQMVRLGLKDEKGDGKRVDWNILDEKFKDVHITTVGVYHDDMRGMMRGKNTVFILEVDGLRIVHLGDLGHLLSKEQIKKIGPVDVLMIPVGGVYTINGTEAKQVVEQLKPKRYILPMHYGFKGYDALLTVDEFLDEQKLKILHPRKELLINASAKPPAEPEIAVMGWEDK
jgi:L-ascorbate metabolism protein UlaG (beta-lactamase superfamily)